MADITIRWSGPSDATSGSTYKVERTLDFSSWSVLAAAQAATSPYVSVSSTLSGSHAYGVTTITVASGTSFSTTGYGWLDDALVQWTGKSTNDLTGVVWHSGYGTYATGTTLYEAHENYNDTGVTPSYKAVVYRVTHTDASSLASAPAYSWYYYPTAPESSDHCVVIVQIGGDIGISPQASITAKAYLTADDEFSDLRGPHLDSNVVAACSTTTNVLGIAEFQCWKTAKRIEIGGEAPGTYTFILGSTEATQLEVTAATIPDRDWVLLKDIGA